MQGKARPAGQQRVFGVGDQQAAAFQHAHDAAAGAVEDRPASRDKRALLIASVSINGRGGHQPYYSATDGAPSFSDFFFVLHLTVQLTCKPARHGRSRLLSDSCIPLQTNGWLLQRVESFCRSVDCYNLR